MAVVKLITVRVFNSDNQSPRVAIYCGSYVTPVISLFLLQQRNF